jgi:hypothetical protein
VSPLRSVVTAHVSGAWNRARRQMGGGALWAFVLILLLLVLFVVVQMMIGMGAVGWFLGRSYVDGSESVFPGIAAFLLTLLVFVGGAFGGLAGSSRRLPWESLQAFPVHTRTLFAAELLAGAVEPMTVVELAGLLGLCVGTGVAAPGAAPYLLVLFPTCVLSLLSIQLIVASLGQRLSKQARVMVFMLPLGALLMSSLIPALLKRSQERSVKEALLAADAVVRRLPIGRLLGGAEEAARGHWSFAPIWPAALMTAVLVFAAWLIVSRETPLSTIDTAKAPRPLWSFKTQMMGVARLQWTALAGSIPGRFGLVMPLITLVLIRGPLAEFTGRGAWVVPGAFTYCALAGTNLLFNQFGLDRHGVKALFLLPIPEAALLRGKLLGFAAWHGLQAILLTGLLAVTGKHAPLELLLGVLIYICFFLVLSMVGQFSSLWQPQPMTRATLRGAQPPLIVVAMMMVTLVTWSSFSMGLLWAVRSFAAGWELPVFATLLLLLAGTSHLVLEGNALFLRGSREKLIEVLGAGA